MDLHPWNNEFFWSDAKGGRGGLSTAEVDQFNADGFYVVEDLIGADMLAQIVAETDEIEAETERLLRTMDNERMAIAEADAIVFAPHLVAQSAFLADVAKHDAIANLCIDLIGPDVNLYWDQAVYKKPQKPRRFPWHQDNGYTFVEPQQYLTVWLALTDATIDNGCPWVVPRMHRSGTLAHTYIEPLGFECFAEHPDAVAAPVAAGGAVVLSSLTPHMTGPNTTNAVRKAYILQYAPSGARILQGDPADGPPARSSTCDAPERQFPIVRDAKKVR